MIKRLLFLLPMFLFCAALVAQNMKVVSFRQLSTDMTANTAGTQRMHSSGKAALIKIVTFDRGFSFDGGSLGIVGNPEYKDGEIWVYVPPRARKITISHGSYGVLREYEYEVPIESARTYEMVLDPGVGKFVNITCGTTGADVYVDGELIGLSPVANHYLMFGNHTVRAVKNKMEGEMKVQIMPTSGPSLDVEMEDKSKDYAQVTVTVGSQAEIWLNGERKAVGRWTAELYKGSYQIETRKDGCDPRITVIDVQPTVQQSFPVTEPEPFHGYLTLSTEPLGVSIVEETRGGGIVNADEKVQLPVGQHVFSFSKKGYVSREETYNIEKDQDIKDRVVLNRIEYVKSNTFYIGAAYTMGNMSGANVVVGGMLHNVNLEATYTYGLGETDPVTWYLSDAFNSLMTYRLGSYGLRGGYQIKAGGRFGFTPQIGFLWEQFSGTKVDGQSVVADGANSAFLTFGCRVHFVPVQHFGIFATPQYNLQLPMHTNSFNMITDCVDLPVNGLSVSVGLSYIF